MARRSKISQLPKAVRDWLDNALVEGNFSGYEALAELMRERGYVISKTAIHRHGQNIERRLDAIRAATDAARLIADAAPDEADQRSAAVISLVQTDVFDVLLTLQEAENAEPTERLALLAQAARAVADLSRASIGQKKHEAGVKARVLAKVEEAATAQGLDDVQARFWREKVLGAF